MTKAHPRVTIHLQLNKGTGAKAPNKRENTMSKPEDFTSATAEERFNGCLNVMVGVHAALKGNRLDGLNVPMETLEGNLGRFIEKVQMGLDETGMVPVEEKTIPLMVTLHADGSVTIKHN